jgi:secreted Zn-dependent insulinase-like peptidase
LKYLQFDSTAQESVYAAELAGLRYGIGSHTQSSSVEIGVSGFSHKLPELVSTVLKVHCISHAACQPSSLHSTALFSICSNRLVQGLAELPLLSDAVLAPIFDRRVDARRRALLGYPKSQPLVLAADQIDACIDVPYVSNAEKLSALDTVTLEGVREYARGLQLQATEDSESRVLAFLYGNATASDASDLSSIVCEKLKAASAPAVTTAALVDEPAPSSHSDNFQTRAIPAKYIQTLLLPVGTDFTLWMPHPNDAEVNAGVDVIWQLGVRTPRNVAVASLLSRLMSAEAFNTLRTQEQLGYIVQSGISSVNGTVVTLSIKVWHCSYLLRLGTRTNHSHTGTPHHHNHPPSSSLLLQIQSSNSSVEHLVARIAAFVESFRAHLAALPPDVVTAKAAVLASQLLETDKTPGAEAERLWTPLRSGTMDFHSAEACAAAVRSLGIADVLALWDACVAPGSPCLRKITSGVYSTAAMPSGGVGVICHGGGPQAVPAGAAANGASGGFLPAAVHAGCWLVPPPHELARLPLLPPQ